MDDKTIFDKKDIYEKELAPLVAEVLKICTREKIPFHIATAVKNDNEDTEYINDGYTTGANNISLADDKIRYHLMIDGGCIAIPKPEEDEINMDYLFEPEDTSDCSDTTVEPETDEPDKKNNQYEEN